MVTSTYHLFTALYALTGFDYNSALAKITENYVKLTALPINDIIGELRAKKVITPKEKETIEETITLQSRRMEHLLDKIIIPSLKNKVGIKFKAFLEVLEDYDDQMLNRMAVTLGKYTMTYIYVCIAILYHNTYVLIQKHCC